MPDTLTYEPIGTTTLTSSSSAIIFNSFSGYTDLALVAITAGNTSGMSDLRIMFNTDTTSSNYSYLVFSFSHRSGTNSIEESKSASYTGGALLDYYGTPTTTLGETFHIVHIFDYASTNHYKQLLSINGAYLPNAGSGTQAALDYVTSAWESNSAVTEIKLWDTGNYFKAGTKVTLFGIKKA
jgi:hypothetical protein